MKKTLELWIVRHGQTTWNAEGLLAGWSDVPLTALGRQQASALQPLLAGEAFDGVWSSDLIRAQETARLAYGDATPDPRLREMNFGDLEGKPFTSLSEHHQKGILTFAAYEAPGGESIETTTSRVHQFIGSLADGRHLIFAHGGVIRLLTQPLGLDEFVHNGTLIALDWTGQQIVFTQRPSLP